MFLKITALAVLLATIAGCAGPDDADSLGDSENRMTVAATKTTPHLVSYVGEAVDGPCSFTLDVATPTEMDGERHYSATLVEAQGGLSGDWASSPPSQLKLGGLTESGLFRTTSFTFDYEQGHPDDSSTYFKAELKGSSLDALSAISIQERHRFRNPNAFRCTSLKREDAAAAE